MLYALQPLNYTDHIEFIYKLLKDDGFEARWQAYNLIKVACNNIPIVLKKKMIDIAQETVNMYLSYTNLRIG